MFGTADMVQTQKDFEMAMAKAESMEQRVDLFLSSSSETMFGAEPLSADEIVTDDEIEKMITMEATLAESGTDEEIEKSLSEIQKELGSAE